MPKTKLPGEEGFVEDLTAQVQKRELNEYQASRELYDWREKRQRTEAAKARAVEDFGLPPEAFADCETEAQVLAAVARETRAMRQRLEEIEEESSMVDLVSIAPGTAPKAWQPGDDDDAEKARLRDIAQHDTSSSRRTKARAELLKVEANRNKRPVRKTRV